MTRDEFDALSMNDRARVWPQLSPAERDACRHLSDLTPQLTGLEGWRVEVTDRNGEKRRFYVSRSTGWRPCHIELLRRDSMGGMAVFGAPFAEIRKLYRK